MQSHKAKRFLLTFSQSSANLCPVMQNTVTVSLPATAIARLTAAVASLPGVRFAGVTYRAKESGELARHCLILGADYGEQIRKSLAILNARENIAVDVATTRELSKAIDATAKGSPARKAANAALASFQGMIGAERAASAELFLSFEETLSAHERGEQNKAYTKAGLYESICPGLQVSRADGTFEISGLQHSKTVLETGVYPVVNSSAKTIAKNEIRKALPVGRYRTLCLDAGALESVRIGGSEIDVS
jgi:hypothetical protein